MAMQREAIWRLWYGKRLGILQSFEDTTSLDGAAVVSGKPVIAIEGDSAFGFSGMEIETTAATVYRSSSWSPTKVASTAATT
jgi:hypothetical protein